MAIKETTISFDFVGVVYRSIAIVDGLSEHGAGPNMRFRVWSPAFSSKPIFGFSPAFG